MNSYDLSRKWFDFCFENPNIIKPNHSALYFFAIEHCNRLGWKNKFGLPTTMAKEAVGIRSYNTYINTLNDLINWGFIEMIEKSKNQFSSNIIALSNFNKALGKALDKALIKHATKQSESTRQSIDSIIKQINNKQYNKKQITKLNNVCISFIKEDYSRHVKEIYNSYPSKCPITNRSSGKSNKDKEKIHKLLKEHDKSHLLKVIELYIADCKNTKTYIKNFATFLNNLPDIEEEKKEQNTNLKKFRCKALVGESKYYECETEEQAKELFHNATGCIMEDITVELQYGN